MNLKEIIKKLNREQYLALLLIAKQPRYNIGTKGPYYVTWHKDDHYRFEYLVKKGLAKRRKKKGQYVLTKECKKVFKFRRRDWYGC